MFSRRSAFERDPNPFALAVAAARRRGGRLLDLCESNPSAVGFAAPPAVLAALADPRAAHYEPEPLGLPSARRAVAAELASAGCAVDASNVVLTCSTSEAYSLAFRLLCDPGDRVLVPRPSYPLLEHLARADGVALSAYRLAPDDAWRLDRADLFSQLEAGPRPRAIVCVSPNNPTGSFVSRDDAALLAGLGLPLVSDEVFAGYAAVPDPPPSLLAAGAPLALALGGLSKHAALPQLKLAWMALAGREAPEALARLEILADAYLSVAAPVQLALPEILALAHTTRAAIRERLTRNRAALARALASSAATLLNAEGGWHAVVRLPATLGDDEWALHLLERRVLVQPGWLYDFEDGPCIVLCLLAPEPDLAEGAAILAEEAACAG